MYNNQPLPYVTVSAESPYFNLIGEVFPNPTVDEFILQFSNPIDPNKISIVNTLGQNVAYKIQNKGDSRFIINISTLSSGLCFINYESYCTKITKL